MRPYLRYITAALLAIIAIISLRTSPVQLGNFPHISDNHTVDDAEYSLGKVIEITKQGTKNLGQDLTAPFQVVRTQIMTGPDANTTITIEHGSGLAITDSQTVNLNQYLIIAKALQAGEPTYYIADIWRLSPMFAVLLLFLALAILFAGRRGAFAVIGCAASVYILIKHLIPAITGGANPFTASILATIAIAAISIFISHGFKRRTVVAVSATILTLVIAAGLAKLFVDLTGLTGAGTEEAFFLQFGILGNINIKGLLLAGMMIGVLGVLDDVTTAQSAAIEELKAANPTFTFTDLYARGISIGSEHIASLVNTLVLAYAGASFPLFLLFTAARTQPLWVILNTESVAEEIIRALIGSAALVLAVPLTTALAAWAFHNHIPDHTKTHSHTHHH